MYNWIPRAYEWRKQISGLKCLAVLCSLAVFLLAQPVMGCSMYKLTKNGKTIVGNNEDWTSPNGQFWFEQGDEDRYGVMYMGFLDDFAQGAINEAGLVFDGFWEPYLEVKDVEGKLEIPIGDALKWVMQTMESVEEVQSYLQTINLTILENGQLVFVDKSGSYLVIEGDEMFMGDEAEKTFSNFYYSQIESLDEVGLPYFQNGQSFINKTTSESTLDYCSEAMAQFSQSNLVPTQYTTVYDLSTLTVRVYLFHDYTNSVEFNLSEELQKGDHRTMIAELFPATSFGYQHYAKYNDTEHPTQLIEAFLEDKEVTEQILLESGFDYIITELGQEWLNQIKNPEAAIKVFQYGLELMPSSVGLHNSLGEAYFMNEDWDQARITYTKSLVLDPENQDAVEMLEKIEELREADDN